jgi:hypothetical protein
LTLFVAVVLALGGAIDEFFSIFANLTDVSKSGVAIFIGAMSAAQAVSSFFAYKLEKYSIKFFHVLLAVAGFLFYVASIMLNISSLVLLTIYSSLYAISSVVLESKIQHLIPSHIRATVTSVQGFIVEVGAIVVYVDFGFLAENLGYEKAFQTFGIIVIGTGLAYFLFSFDQYQTRTNS